MHVFASFEHSMYLEIALTSLEQKGIAKENILAVPLNNRKEQRRLFDTLHRSDGYSLFDIAAALATAFAVVGAGVGFKLAWGPIFWGLIGGASGFATGFLIDVIALTLRNRKQRTIKGRKTEVIVLIHCEGEQVEMVEKLLWDHLALGVGKLERE